MIDTEALRKKVIDLAIQGKLTEQLPSDGDAETLYAQIKKKSGFASKHEGKGKIDTKAMDFDIPQTWQMVEFGVIFDFIDYRGKTPNKISEGVFLITASNIKHGFMDYTRKEYISRDEYSERQSRGITRKGDILFTTEAPMGNVAICNLDECSCGQRVITFQPYDDNVIYPPLFMYFILSSPFQKELLDNASGTTAKGIKADRLKRFIIPMPPYAEQKRIADRLEGVLAQIDIIDDLQAKYSNDLAVLKSKIIDAGIRGKLTEQLPEDGDAEDLYAQILNQKSQLIKEGKIKKEKPLPDIAADEIPFEVPKNWKWVRLPSLFYQVGSKNNQIQSNQLLSEGLYPAISQGKKPIDGYTNDSDKVITDVPLILFGDHTRNVKYIGEPFVICADGTQLLKPIAVDCEFFYYVIWSISANITSRGYSRHFSLLKKSLFQLPPMTEQKRIVERIKSFIEQID